MPDVSSTSPLPRLAGGFCLAAGLFMTAPAAGQGAETQLDTIVVESERTGRPSRDSVRSPTDLTAPNTTGSRLPGTARDIPASVEAVNQATMQERGNRNWVEALQGLTGFTAAIRPGAAGIMSARGFTENGFALLYDGIRVSSTTISARNYDSFVFDRIEVLRGPASVLYGEGAVGGAINLVRKQPSAVDQPFEAITSVSTPGGVRLGLGKGGVIGESFAYRVDGVVTRDLGQVDDNRIRQGQINGALRWQVNERFAATIDFDYLRSSIDNAYWGTPLVRGAIAPALRRVNYNTIANNRYDDSVLWLRARFDYETDDGWRLSHQVWNHQANRDWINAYRFAAIPAGGTCRFRGQSLVNGTGTDQVCRMTWENLGYDHRFTGNRAEAAYRGRISGLEVAATFGVELAQTRWTSPRSEVTSLQLVDPFNPPATDFFSRGTARNQTVRANLTQGAVFGEGRVEVLPGVKLVAGFRSDWLAVDYDRQPANQTYSRNYQPFTYRVGAVWDVWSQASLYASFATAVEPRFALFTLGATDTPFSLTEARQIEIGFKQGFWNGRGEVTAALYRIEKTNVPSTDPLTGNTVQVGRQSSQGFEIGGSYRPVDEIRLTANLAMVEARYDEFRSGSADFAGNRPPNVPRWVANLGAVWSPDPKWSLGGSLSYRSSIAADDANTVKLPAALIADVFATYRVSASADVTLRVHNLTDAVYAAWATDANYVILGRPRTFELGVRARF
ncbi:TonB-dependent receptor [Phreatobacter stygius]|uniref:TonB-dependent receptor n=1 Tax=Phreatobacter stygius TaxID=1940610 RepID=A0A4D7BD48_9HYPH|nr:TonB-dependent receptor [Phreatobacter stygius]QCI67296.1 TonB-dependent receptor [Phreatobacter stygius]